MTRPVPCWQCEKCSRWTPHGRYSCQFCHSPQPQYPEMRVLMPDGSLPLIDDKPAPDKGPRIVPHDLSHVIKQVDYDDLVKGEP